jgi:hypothetical protein
MGVIEEAASGPASPDLGSGRTDNAGSTAGSERKSSGLDKAIAAAMGGPGETETDVPLQLAKAKQDADKGKRTKPVAGDKSGSEDAQLPESQAEANPAEAAPQGNAPVREAPKHWPEERRKAFAAWTKEVQDHALQVDKDLQAGFTRKSQELGDKAKYADAIRDSIDDTVRQQFAQAGMDEVAGVRYLTSVQKFATSRPVEYVGWVMQQLGVTPQHLGFSASSRQPDNRQQQPQGTGNAELDALLTDPAVKQLSDQFGQFSQQAQQRIQQLESQIAARQAAEHNYAQQRQHAEVQTTRNLWTGFRSELDDAGQLKYPHADTLMQSMGALMDSKPSLRSMSDGPEKLTKAYEMALKADPELSQPFIEAEVAKRLAEKEKKADAERARKAVGVKPASGAPGAPAKKSGLDGALAGAMDKLGFT